MRRLALLLVVLVLAGCGEQVEPNETHDLGTTRYGIDEYTVPLSDGREVICLFQAQTGVDCDWANAEEPIE